MAGPWEKFAIEPTAPAGPWAKFAPVEEKKETPKEEPRKRGVVEDMVLSGIQGGADNVAAVIDAANPANLARKTGAFLTEMVSPLPQPGSPEAKQMPGYMGTEDSTPASDAVNAAYTPETTAGRYTRAGTRGATGGAYGVASGVGAEALGDAGEGIGQAMGGERGGQLGRVIGNVVGAFAAPAALNRMVAARMPSTSGKVLGDINNGLQGRNIAKGTQNTLLKQQTITESAENKAWDKLRKNAAGKTVPWKDLGKVQEQLQDAQMTLTNDASANIVDRSIQGINRFISGGIDAPAEKLIAVRRTLSKASTKDAGLRPVVDTVDDIIKNQLQVEGLDEALGASTKRFENFADREAVAKAVEPGVTPESVGKLFSFKDSQAADKFDQVISTVKNTKGDVSAARANLQRGITHNLFEDAVDGSTPKGELLVNPSKLADNIVELRKNESLWQKLSSPARQGLSDFERELRSGNPIMSAIKFTTRMGLKMTGFGDFATAIGVDTRLPLGKILSKMKEPTGGAMEAAKKGAVGGLGVLTESQPTAATQSLEQSDNTDQGASSSSPVHIEVQPTVAPAPSLVPEPMIPPVSPAQDISRTVLHLEEGVEPKSYVDSEGFRTVGAGFNMDQANAKALWAKAGVGEKFDDVYKGLIPLSQVSIDKLYNTTGSGAERAARKLVPNYSKLGINQQAALNSLAFQLGGEGLAKFKNMLQYLREGNAKAVENSLINSKMGKSQSPARTRRTALMLAYNMTHEEADRQLAEQGRIKPNERKYT